MDLIVERDGGIVCCFVDGRVDSDTAMDFRDQVIEVVSEGDELLLLDLSPVNYVSSAGLQSFLIIARQMGQQGVSFAVCSLTEGVRQVFEVAGFDRVLTVYRDRQEAVASRAGRA